MKYCSKANIPNNISLSWQLYNNAAQNRLNSIKKMYKTTTELQLRKKSKKYAHKKSFMKFNAFPGEVIFLILISSFSVWEFLA